MEGRDGNTKGRRRWCHRHLHARLRSLSGALLETDQIGDNGSDVVLSVGGGVSPGTPRENVLAMLEALARLRAPWDTILRVDAGKSWLPARFDRLGSATLQVMLLKPLR